MGITTSHKQSIFIQLNWLPFLHFKCSDQETNYIESYSVSFYLSDAATYIIKAVVESFESGGNMAILK